jgi:membrane fusion protein, macrolide-specific efflux system
MRKSGRKRILLAIAVLAFLAGGGLVLRGLFGPKPPQYLTAKAVRADIEDSVLATGTLQAIKEVDVGTQVGGQLKSLATRLGDHVKKNQFLAEIDPVISANNLRAARAARANLVAQRRAAQARLRQARLEFERQKRLIGDQATSRHDLEIAEAQMEVEAATIDAFGAQIEEAGIAVDTAAANLGYTRITAPMEGDVITVLVQEGQTVVAAQLVPVLLKLADLERMTVKAQISEADIIRIHVGDPVRFSIMGDPDRHYSGTLRAIEPAPKSYSEPAPPGVAGGGSGNIAGTSVAVVYNALFEVPNPGHFLRIGMTAQVSIVLHEAKNAIAIPVASLGGKGPDGRYAVRILDADGKVETRQVRVGISNTVHAEILDGLAEGDTIVTGEAGGAVPDSLGVAGES